VRSWLTRELLVLKWPPHEDQAQFLVFVLRERWALIDAAFLVFEERQHVLRAIQPVAYEILEERKNLSTQSQLQLRAG
jgi:hypothetical protein